MKSAISAEEFSHLSQNKKNRYAINTPRVASALIISSPNGETLAHQYAFPDTTCVEAPSVCSLKDIRVIQRLGTIRYTAKGLNGANWYATRSDSIVFQDASGELQKGEIAYFSEEEGPGVEPEWHDTAKTSSFNTPLTLVALDFAELQTLLQRAFSKKASYPWKQYPSRPRKSDLAQATGICRSLLQNMPPVSTQPVLMEATPSSETSISPWRPVPLFLTTEKYDDPEQKIASIIDLETTSLNSSNNKIIQIGILTFTFTKQKGILSLVNTYKSFNDPHCTLSPEVMEITGITDADVHGQAIDWHQVSQLIEQSEYLLCYNSAFDRKVLEQASPEAIQNQVKAKKFGCVYKGIPWDRHGYYPKKSLGQLNASLYFYFDGHEALRDCWATLNLLRELKWAWDELVEGIEKKSVLICAVDAPIAKQNVLQDRGFQWSSGKRSLPKCWYTHVFEEELDTLKQWLDDEIFASKGQSHLLPQKHGITAIERYSVREDEPLLLSGALNVHRLFNQSSGLPGTQNKINKKRKSDNADLNVDSAVNPQSQHSSSNVL